MAVLRVYLVCKLMIFVGLAQCVLFSDVGGPEVGGTGRVGGSVGDGGGGNEDDLDDRHHTLHTSTVSTAVKSCLAGADPFLPCINEQAMAAIEQTESMDSVVLDSGLEISRRPGTEAFAAPRGVYSLGKPARCRRSASRISTLHDHPCRLKWDMNPAPGSLVCGVKFRYKSSKIDFVKGSSKRPVSICRFTRRIRLIAWQKTFFMSV